MITYKDYLGNSHDLTPYWQKNSLRILDSINNDENECSFILFNPPWEPMYGETIQVFQSGVPLFGGKLTRRPEVEDVRGYQFHHVTCPGFSRLLYRIFVRDLTNGGPKIYTSTNDVAVMQDLITNYAPGFTQTKVKTGSTVTIDYLSLFCSLPEAFDRVRSYSGKYWKVDAQRDIEYHSKAQKALVAADVFPLGDAMPYFKDLKHSKGDIRQLKNRVILRSYRQSNTITDKFHFHYTSATKRDNVVQLAWRPIQGTVSVTGANLGAGIPQGFTIGYDPPPMIFTQDLYVNCDYGKIYEGAATFFKARVVDQIITVEYKARQPIEMVRQDTSSQAIIAAIEGDSGVYDSLEFHREMISQTGAVNLSDDILDNWSEADANGEVTVWYPGVRAGWLINMAIAERDIDDQFVVQQVETSSMGDGIPGRLEHRLTYGKRYYLPSFYTLWRGLKRKIDTVARVPEHTWPLTS